MTTPRKEPAEQPDPRTDPTPDVHPDSVPGKDIPVPEQTPDEDVPKL